MKCPICRKDVAPDAPELPFCSPRCKLIDLGNWASEKYLIPGAPADPASNGKEPDEN